MQQNIDYIKFPPGTSINSDFNIVNRPTSTMTGLFITYNGILPNILSKDIYIPTKKRKKCMNKIYAAINKVLDDENIVYNINTITQLPQRYMHNDEIGSAEIDDDTLEVDTDEYMDDMCATGSLVSYIYTFKFGDSCKTQIINIIDGWKMIACFTQTAKVIVDKIYSKLCEFEEEPEYAKKIMLVTRGNYGFNLEPMDVCEPKDFDIDELYPDDFKPIDEGVRNFIESDKSGLIILHGLQGTGKTTYIRNLIYQFNKKFIFLPVELASELSSPAFISFVKDSAKGAILVIEDCEVLLRDRSKMVTPSNGISNILNMSDGLLGDSIKLKFICTFNSKYEDIDQALIRKGRLKEQYEFKELPLDKTNRLLKKIYGEDTESKVPMPLSDIFNYQTDNHSKNTPKKEVIGF